MARETLTEALDRLLKIGKTVSAPRPGSNFLPMLAVYSEDESIEVTGEELEDLYRAGLLDARPERVITRVDDSEEEFGGIDRDHEWFVTPAGRQALAEREGKDER